MGKYEDYAALRDKGISISAISRQFGVSLSAVYDCLRRREDKEYRQLLSKRKAVIKQEKYHNDPVYRNKVREKRRAHYYAKKNSAKGKT